MSRWNRVTKSLPPAFWPMWVITSQEAETPAVGWWDGSDWWVFIDGHGAECNPEEVIAWCPMSAPAEPRQ